jgi:hypothetical protein
MASNLAAEACLEDLLDKMYDNALASQTTHKAEQNCEYSIVR